MAVAQAQTEHALPATEARPNPLLGIIRLPLVKQLGVMAGLAASVALGLVVVLWSQTPNYSLLYGSLSPQAAAEVVDALTAAEIPYRLDDRSGAVTVPAGKVHDARLKLAGQGLPRGTDMGFEILEKEQGFGTSQFVERARYQRALEVELARSIGTLSTVRSARVHLALPKQSVFVRNRKHPSASVLVHLYSGGAPNKEQVAAIAHLVAASVPNMDAGDVKVVDHRGNLLTPREHSPEANLTQTQFDYTRRLESDYVKRIEDILSPVLGPDGLRAQVTADIDFTRTEQTRETFNPDLPALRSERVLEESGSAAAAGGGIPGALSNQPPGPAAAPERAAAGEAGGTAGGTAAGPGRKQAVRNYELDKTISHTVLPTAVIRRLSVAVVVDNLRLIDAEGKASSRPRPPEEIERITGLVKEAVGYDVQRGDRVNVINAAFTGPLPEEPIPEPALWEQQWIWDMVKQAFGVLLVLFLVLGILRPAMRRLTSHEVAAREVQARLANEAQEDAEAGLSEDRLSISGPGVGTPRLAGAVPGAQGLETVRSVVSEDPQRVAQVMRSWVSDDE